MGTASRIRVALVSFSFGEYCARLAEGLAAEADVLLIVPRRTLGTHAAGLPDAVRVLSFDAPRLRQPARQIRVLRMLLRSIRRFDPHVIHYQGGHLWFDLAFPLLRRYPRVLTIHDFQTHPGDRLSEKTPACVENLARHAADELIVHTRYVQELVRRHSPGRAGQITVIPHVQIGQGLRCVDGQPGTPLILFFGRIWEYKGLEYLIRAEPLITERVPSGRILIAGQGEDFSRYARMMTHPDCFIVHNGFIPDELVEEYFRRASVVVLPYIEASQSGVIPMAYSAGKPVVATRVGGLPEMVEDGVTGRLVAPQNPMELADAITDLLLDKQLRLRMGANGKRKIAAECSPCVIARTTMEVYFRAMKRYAAQRELPVSVARLEVGG